MWKPVQARKGADLPYTFGAHRVAGWRKDLKIELYRSFDR